jgi:hypothetical protein
MGGMSGRYEVFNNYIVNWSARLSRINGPIQVDWFSNYAQAGNVGRSSSAPVNKVAHVEEEWHGSQPSIYSADNYIDGVAESPGPRQNELWVWFKNDDATVGATRVVENEPIDPSLMVDSAQLAEAPPADGAWGHADVPERISAEAGHVRGVEADGRRGFFRDDLDSDYVRRSMENDTLDAYRTPSEWTESTFTGTELYEDRDGDHMPDWFEEQHAHLDPDDGSDADESEVSWDFGVYRVQNDAGYSNLEICAEYYAGGFETMLPR